MIERVSDTELIVRVKNDLYLVNLAGQILKGPLGDHDTWGLRTQGKEA